MSEEEIRKLERGLEEYERKRQEKAKLFDPKEFSAKEQEVYIPELDRVVRFKRLTGAELIELQRREPDPNKIVDLVLWKMLNKVDPSITLDEIRNLDGEVYTLLIQYMRPFQILARSSEPAPQRK